MPHQQAVTSSPRVQQRGVAMVEFAISVPIMLMLLIGVAEFGQAFRQYNRLTKSVEDGARYVAGRALQGSTGVVMLSGGLQAEGRNLVVHGNVLSGNTAPF